jgi:site-specific DNA-methyltransferase (cytosine-N4-specific)
MVRKSDLPFGSEFSPSNIDLKTVLEFAKEHGGDWKAFEAAVHDAFFNPQKFPKTDDYNRRKRANNTKLGMQAYGIIDDDACLTPFGEALYGLRNDEQKLYEALARHILLNLHGSTLLQCIQDMETGGETVTLVKLRAWLAERGVHFPSGGKHPSMMRLWLEKAGVFVSGWRIDEARLAQLRGVGSEELEALAKLTPLQRSFLKALISTQTADPQPSNEIARLAHTAYGSKFDEKNLQKQVVYPLEAAGYIEAKRETRAKPPLIWPTHKLKAEIVEPLLVQMERQLVEGLRPFLRKPIADVVKELQAEDKHIRGLALEALAIKLMRLVDLDYRATRLLGKDTGGAEVDVVFDSTRLVFSRWQVQCKNTRTVSLDDVAKEYGLTFKLKSSVIVMVSTGAIGDEARRFANDIMNGTSLCVIMIDGQDIARIVKSPTAIVDILNREDPRAMAQVPFPPGLGGRRGMLGSPWPVVAQASA